jgi:cell wall-associated NlpC family hydrolase
MLKIFFYLTPLFFLFGCHVGFTPKQHEENIWKHTAMVPAASPVATPPLSCDVAANDKIVAIARAQIGTPYRYGGMDESGFDCSGFVCYVYNQALGKKLPHSARKQSEYVEIYDLSMLTKGDLLFFDTSGRGRINHCGIYLGGGKFIHASSGKAYSVTISDLTKGFYKKAFRWGGKVQMRPQK